MGLRKLNFEMNFLLVKKKLVEHYRSERRKSLFLFLPGAKIFIKVTIYFHLKKNKM
jgi:hypothetical protein